MTTYLWHFEDAYAQTTRKPKNLQTLKIFQSFVRQMQNSNFYSFLMQSENKQTAKTKAKRWGLFLTFLDYEFAQEKIFCKYEGQKLWLFSLNGCWYFNLI